MIKLRGKNKNELLALTGAIYSFVAYLMAFTLEVLFLIDLARRLSSPDGVELVDQTVPGDGGGNIYSNSNNNDQQAASLFNAFDAMQTHRTISCLAIAILYFIIFIASLILIVALILRSTFMLLIWMCAMTTMYLPEFGLVVYVSVYSWGLSTRNGQTELVFYMFRAVLNLLFIFKAHRLFKQWSYEKSFYRLKSSSQFTGYDSPYFIGDSLTTTINPVFSPTSTLNNSSRYDHVRDSLAQSPTNASIFSLSNNNLEHLEYPSRLSAGLDYRGNRLVASGGSTYSREFNVRGLGSGSKFKTNYDHNQSSSDSTATTATPKRTRQSHRGDFFIGDGGFSAQRERRHADLAHKGAHERRMNNSTSSILSINDEFPEYELDLDYRTLSHGRNNHKEHAQHYEHHHHHHQPSRIHYPNYQKQRYYSHQPPDDSMVNSTQSLDRRHLRDVALPDQVILRPLGHQPFEYLHRPGSSSNINSLSNLNTQPSSLYSSHAKLTKRSEHDLSHRRL